MNLSKSMLKSIHCAPKTLQKSLKKQAVILHYRASFLCSLRSLRNDNNKSKYTQFHINPTPSQWGEVLHTLRKVQNLLKCHCISQIIYIRMSFPHFMQFLHCVQLFYCTYRTQCGEKQPLACMIILCFKKGNESGQDIGFRGNFREFFGN